MKENTQKLATSSKILPIATDCMTCKGKLFTSNSLERQTKVKESFGSIPSDCVDSSIDGHKCPFITGKAFERTTTTQKIPQHCDGYHNQAIVC